MVADVGGLLAGLKFIGDRVSTLHGIRDENLINTAVFEISRKLREVSSEIDRLSEERDTLRKENLAKEAELVRLKQFDASVENYATQRVGMASTIYVVKPGMAGAEKGHWLCVTCFEDKQYSPLVFHGMHPTVMRAYLYKCPKCDSPVTSFVNQKPGPQP